jgi:large subunit ribosomal protein L23Ae
VALSVSKAKANANQKTQFKRAKNPQYPCINTLSRDKLDHYEDLKHPLTTKSTMKKTKDNNTLSFIADARADTKKIKDS